VQNLLSSLWVPRLTQYQPQMTSSSETHYLRSIMSSIPKEIAFKIRQLCIQPTNEILLENLVRFLAGAPHTADASDDLRVQWVEKQTATRDVLSSLTPSNSDRKRTRSDDEMDVVTDHQLSKRQRLVPSSQGSATPKDFGNPIFSLISISATSPVRKKVDITIHENAVVFTNSLTKVVEGSVPVSSIKRAFIVPTRGKSKPHWTVILLSGDIPDNPKAKPAVGSGTSENQQVIFGLDANTAATFTTTTFANNDSVFQSYAKNSPTLPHIQTFLSHLDIPVIFPSASTFKSACGGVLAGSSASTDGIPGVGAYRAAKAGNLWFSEEGILWGESKPCEFWAVKDLIGKEDGVRIVGSGRTCSVVLTRRLAGGENEDEDVAEETEFGLVDGLEREPINSWVRNHRHMFGSDGAPLDKKGKGKEKEVIKSKSIPSGPLTIQSLPDESDDDDDEFRDDGVSDLDGSDGSSSEESEEGSVNGEDDDGDADSDLDEDEGELDPAHHPLLRAGAVPRMSKSARDMVVGIVEEAFMGSGGREEDGLDEEDELED